MLDFGRQIFEGTSAEMLVSPVVKAAYLGSEGGVGGEELASIEAAATVAETSETC